MKIIVHAGMHKTGSTSLQLAFADANAPDFHYLHGDHENFSMSMFLLFEDEDRLENHLYHRISQTSKSDLLARRKKLRAKIEKQIESHSKPVLLVSGEDISGFNGRVVGRLAEFLQSYSSDIQVITYVRPPCAYMESAFQERLKHQLVEADPTLLWPRYQRRLSNVVRAFGVENNTFVKFDRSDLCNGNVIDDFSRRSGLSRPNDVAREFNSSVSAEAVALTYAYRKLIRSEPPQGAKMSHVDMVFRTRLAEIGTSKLRFDAGFREKGDAHYEGDIAWMEEHLGASLAESRGTGTGFISGSDDLMALAEKNLPKLRALNAKLGAPSVQSLQDNLNALHSHVVKHQRLFSLKDKLRTVSALGYRKVFKRLKARLT